MTTYPDSPIAVVGATGGVGEGITRTLLRAGRPVIAVGRSASRLQALRDRLSDVPTERLNTIAGDLAAPWPESAQVAEQLAAVDPPLAGAVVTVGDWIGGDRPVLSIDDETWEAGLAANLTGQFRVLRALVPVLGADAALVHIAGASAETPFPGRALIGLTNAARKSLVLSLAQELATTGPRVYELLIGVTVTRRRRAAGQDDPRLITAEQVGERALALIDGTDPGSDETLHRALFAPSPEPAPAGEPEPEPEPETETETAGPYRIDPGATVGHVALRITDVPRALGFYADDLGLDIVTRFDDQAAFVSAGGYHHHVALLAAPRPGLEHVAIRYPTKAALAAALDQLHRRGIPAQGPVDHGPTLSVYLSDPDGNGIELYVDQPA